MLDDESQELSIDIPGVPDIDPLDAVTEDGVDLPGDEDVEVIITSLTNTPMLVMDIVATFTDVDYVNVTFVVDGQPDTVMQVIVFFKRFHRKPMV